MLTGISVPRQQYRQEGAVDDRLSIGAHNDSNRDRTRYADRQNAECIDIRQSIDIFTDIDQ